MQRPGALLKQLRSEAHVRLPRGLRPPRRVAQILIHDSDIKTKITLVNFPSFFAPSIDSSYSYIVSVQDGHGRTLAARRFPIGRWHSRELVPAEELGCAALALGLVVVELKPANPLFMADRHLGDLTPHFFTVYESARGGSALIHPQSMLGRASAPSLSWQSNALIECDRLGRIQLYQMNPSDQAVSSKLLLRDVRSREPVWIHEGRIEAGGVRRVDVDMADLPRGALVRLGAEGLGSDNAKPLLLMRLQDGTLMGMHS
jgi:hypothetical protein